ncbi:hypothetical protein SEUCBS139899_006995 [Sporothrix eucalyptigena]|uniref:Heterokaryon incompatibility domain-containing protein n=1 Tax=Sporothrix eucalyptigena TaxID=1812306 RepID=A0ABP0C454_9PEZI
MADANSTATTAVSAAAADPETNEPVGYKYSSLKNDEEIRLLELYPGSGDDIIRVELYSAPIEHLPPFEAISYCWGDPTFSYTILVNEKPLAITSSLHGALKRFRPVPDGSENQKPRTLWADAICIQQMDLVEKACQVMHMPHVYTQAWRVLVWLGEEEEDGSLAGLDVALAQAMQFLPDTPLDAEGLHQTAQTVLRQAQELQKQGKPNFLDHDWSSLIRLIERPWFRRKWVIQEVCLAKDAVVVVGNITFPWAHLAEVSYNTMASGVLQLILGNTSLLPQKLHFEHRYDDEAGDGVVHPQHKTSDATSIFFQNIQIMRMIRTFRHAGTLLDCVMATALFDCTNPRDHVYALLSLPVHPTSHQVLPNYIQSPTEAFTEFAVATLVGEQNLKLLGLAPQLSRPKPRIQRTNTDGTPRVWPFTFSEPLDLPSWVPNLTGQGLVNPFTCYSVLPQLFHAGGKITPPVAVSDDNKLLYLKARVVDTVTAFVPRNIKFRVPSADDIAPYLPRFNGDAQLGRRQMWHRNYLRVCKNFFQGGGALDNNLMDGSRDNLPMTPDEWLTFARVMTCEQNNRRDSLPPAVYDAFDEYTMHILNIFADEPPNEEDRANIERMMMQFGIMLEASVLTVSSMRILGRTASGRLGQLPIETRVGDKVVVLMGAETPFILRPIKRPEGDAAAAGNWQPDEERYQLIGDTYISGIMQGETLQDEQYTTRQITIE